MTSATMRRDRGARQGEGYWMIVFAVALLVTVGFFNLIDGIAAIANSHVFIANAHYVVGDLRAWGWVVLILGVLQLIAASALRARRPAIFAALGPVSSPAGNDLQVPTGATPPGTRQGPAESPAKR